MEDVPAAKRRCVQPAINGAISDTPEVIVIDSDESLCIEPEDKTEELQQPEDGLNESQPRFSTPLPGDKEEEVEVLLNNANSVPVDKMNGEDTAVIVNDDKQVLNESMQSFIDEGEDEEVEGASKDGVTVNGGAAGEPSLMECLPNEVLEDVFVWVPLIELFTSCRLVSKRWNQVISREKFLYWKKTYYQVKAHHLPVVARVDSLILKHIKTTPPNVTLLRLAKMVSDTFKHPDIDLAKMDKVLKKHPQYSCVQQISQLKKTKRKKVLHLVFLLNTPQRGGLSPPILTHTQLTEIMFCLATFLYSLWIKEVLPPRFHYYVYYAMNVLERSSPSALLPFSSHDISAAVSVRQPLSPPVPLTSEQMMIVNHPYQQGETVKVVAFAGTGKTATLVELARRHPEKKFLYCVYNKSVQVHAENYIFGKQSNVSCYTFHGVTYESCPQGKLNPDLGKMDICSWLKTEVDSSHHGSLANAVFGTLNNFFSSDDTEISEEHIKYIIEDKMDMEEDEDDDFPFTYEEIVAQAKQIWARMRSTERKDFYVKLSFDGYLKAFQLSDNVLKDWEPEKNKGRETFDVLLVDEAQDLTPAIFSILKRQPCAKLFVGDPHQSIYRFRGAVNAIASVEADRTYYLTRSFRFGPEIAYVSSLLLSVMKDVKSETLVGGLQESSIQGDRKGQVAIIARTNNTLYDEVIRVAGSTDLSNMKLGFAGKIDSYKFNVLLDIYKLKSGVKSSSLKTFVKRYKSYQALKKEAASSKDVPLQTKISVCEKYGSKLPNMVEQIKKQSCSRVADADIVFTTAHKSKGLEFDTVVVANDFMAYYSTEYLTVQDLHKIIDDERHLVYVAATRAKKRLVMSSLMLKIIQLAREPFLFLGGSTDEVDASQPQAQTCVSCARQQEPLTSSLGLTRKKFELSSGTVLNGGIVCKMCSARGLPALVYS